MLIFLALVHGCCVCRVALLQSTRSVPQGLVAMSLTMAQ
jgi:hypothetical protein